eukprot:4522773-Heterocapsa_arctica.AAC.1
MEERGNQIEGGDSRKRSRPPAREFVQEPVPMEVDQEGEYVQESVENHGAEQEGQAFANHHQYEVAPVGGWNHEAEDPTQVKRQPAIDLVPEYDIREDILRLGLRVYEAVVRASRKDEVVKEYRLYDLLDKVKKVLEAGQAMQPPVPRDGRRL